MKLSKKMLRPKWNSIPDWTKNRAFYRKSTKLNTVKTKNKMPRKHKMKT